MGQGKDAAPRGFPDPLTLDTFRLKAHRAVMVDFKVFPWSDAGSLDWRQRFGATYFVAPAQCQGDSRRFARLYADSKWRVFRLP